jgi:hypothetical protein
MDDRKKVQMPDGDSAAVGRDEQEGNWQGGGDRDACEEGTQGAEGEDGQAAIRCAKVIWNLTSTCAWIERFGMFAGTRGSWLVQNRRSQERALNI